jgi:hypothetical protein
MTFDARTLVVLTNINGSFGCIEDSEAMETSSLRNLLRMFLFNPKTLGPSCDELLLPLQEGADNEWTLRL